MIIEKEYWGLGIGDWGLGIGGWAPFPIPQRQYPNPHTLLPVFFLLFIFF